MYRRDVFRANGIELLFVETAPYEYRQFHDTFVRHLSVIDLMMHRGRSGISTGMRKDFALNSGIDRRAVTAGRRQLSRPAH